MCVVLLFSFEGLICQFLNPNLSFLFWRIYFHFIIRYALQHHQNHNITSSITQVLKPTDSAGSDGVKLCHSIDEAKEHFQHLLTVEAVNGGFNTEVLCQEFLRGKEYVIDHVSRNGVHKTMAVWVYDKRPRNGSQFVYFGMWPIDPESEEAKVLIPYTRGVLDALGMKHGVSVIICVINCLSTLSFEVLHHSTFSHAYSDLILPCLGLAVFFILPSCGIQPSHGEVIITDDGPCLVEMNCRAHGGDGNWHTLELALNGGYSQVEGTAVCYLDEAEFHDYPDKPASPLQSHGCDIMLVSYSQGKVKSTPGFDIIQRLPSYVCMAPAAKVGGEVKFTVDLITSPGCVILMNDNKDVLEKDISFIRYMEEINGLFVYDTHDKGSLGRPSTATYGLGSAASGMARRGLSMEMRPGLLRVMTQDRPEIRGGMRKKFTTIDSSKEVVVVVCPYSTGCVVVQEIQSRGYRVIALWPKTFSDAMKLHVPVSCGKMSYFAEVTEGDDPGETSRELYKAAGSLKIVACICGGEAGVDLTDIMSERLLVRSNGTEGEFARRRDKKIQQELIKAAGIRSIRQCAGKKYSDVEAFLKSEDYPVVLKPTDGAGSDGVKLCHDIEEAREHFEHILVAEAINGGYNTEVLCQEYLNGKEYVIDTASRDGEHKTMGLWVYDKRPANGSFCVYFGMLPIDSSSPEAKYLIPYTNSVLDALGMKNGPSHAEVIITPSGPCLVEMNCRAHGGDGNWRLMSKAFNGGYSQVEATVDAYLDKKAFATLPTIPPSPPKAFGQEVIMVSYAQGEVVATPGYDVIKQLDSFVYLETGISIGSKVEHSVDLVTSVGSVILLNTDKAVLQNDVETIRSLEKNNELFVLTQSGTLTNGHSALNLLRQ